MMVRMDFSETSATAARDLLQRCSQLKDASDLQPMGHAARSKIVPGFQEITMVQPLSEAHR